MSEIRSHTCASEFQDAQYGRGMRVWNPTVKGLRCTVCSGETSTPSKAEAKPAKATK